MRVSRPCYDKPHRCPGWAGGGWRYAKVERCPSAGYISLHDEARRLPWNLRLGCCPKCGVRTLPFITRYLDPRWWRHPVFHLPIKVRLWLIKRGR